MPVDPDLQTLRADALDLAEVPSGSNFASATRVNRYINACLAQLHDLQAMNAGGEEYIRKTDTITLVAGTPTYALAADFYKLIAVYWTGSAGSHLFQLDRWTPANCRGWRSSPAQSGSLRYDYVPQAPVLVNDTDEISAVTTGAWTFSCSPVWPDWVAHAVAVRLMNKEETESARMMAVRDELWGVIKASLPVRDYTSQQFVADAFRHDPGPEAYDARCLAHRLIAAQTIEIIESEVEGY